MTAPSTNKTTIGVTAFKSQCLGLIDDVAQGKTDRIILLKHNRPIAAIVPIHEEADGSVELWGAMRGTVTFPPDIDLTEPAGVVWDVLQEE